MNVSRGRGSYLESQSKAFEDPWQVALRETEDKAAKDLHNVEKIDTLTEVLESAKSKENFYYEHKSQWSFKRSNGEVKYFHEYYTRIFAGLQRFKEIGDTVVQYDPGHAALPWAAIRFFL